MMWQRVHVLGYTVDVSSSGAITIDRIARPAYITDQGYERVTIGGKSMAVHRLVALAFIPNSAGLPEVNHIDGDKRNNCVTNLEWCTRSQNMRHAYAIGLHPGVKKFGADNPAHGKLGRLHKQSMAVEAAFADGTRRTYGSQLEAERDGFSSYKISDCIHGRRRTHKGATWRPLPAGPTGAPA